MRIYQDLAKVVFIESILKINDGSKLLLANLALDSQEFYPDHNNTPFKHNGAEGYVNTYKLSEIRKWLNDNFYNTAFNSTEQKIILLSDFSTREYVQSLKEMPKENRDMFIQMSNKALSLDDALLSFIMMFDSKEQIKEMRDDLKTISKNG